MFRKRNYGKSVWQLGLMVSVLNAAACGTGTSKSELRDVLSSSTWTKCSLDFSKKVNNVETHVYSQWSAHFDEDGTFLIKHAYYATDAACKNLLSDAQKSALKSELDSSENKLSGTYAAAAIPGTSDLYALDLHIRSEDTQDLYTTMRVTENTLQISPRCPNEAYVKEGLCKKVDGTSPESRANYLSDPLMKEDVLAYKRALVTPQNPQASELGTLLITK